MSTVEIPLGQIESQQLEFKSAREVEDIAKSKSDLGRSVVAMLNASGGVIWIGLAEHDGRATEVENVVNPMRAKDAVENHVLSTVTPRLRPGEFSVDAETVDSKTILRVEVKEGQDKPYAFDRHKSPFYVRVGSRIRGMSRDELREAFSETRTTSMAALDSAREQLDRLRTAQAKHSDSVFWVGLIPVDLRKDSSIEVDLEDVKNKRLLADARTTGSRQGSVLATDRIDPVLQNKSLRISRPGWGSIAISRNGHIEQLIPIESLWDRGHRTPDGFGEGLIHPIAWIENLTFPLRVLGAILDRSASTVRGSARHHVAEQDLRQVEVAVAIAMLHASGTRMRPYSPDVIGYLARDERTLPTEDGHWHAEEVFAGAEVVKNPDRCAFRLTKAFYSDFAFDPLDLRGGDGIPHQFDRVSGKLILPE